jgi:hypothetical protein
MALVAILALAVPLLTGAGASAQEASPPASPAALPPLLQQAVDAFNGGDAAAVAALYTEDGTHEDIPIGVRVQGREEITAYVDEDFGQLDDFRFEPVFGRLEGDLIRRSTDHYDLATILGQLGLLDPGEGTAEATPGQ